MTICRDRTELTRALADARHRRGLSQEALDDAAGFTDGYTSKLEQPFSPTHSAQGRRTGRCAIHQSFDWWIKALGIGIVVVPDMTRKEWRDVDIDREIAALELLVLDMKRARVRSIANTVRTAQRQGIRRVRP